ncbi:MAG: glycosyltransferase family 2 protein [Ignavibacteria bacterium]|nr:glycosyltransferase family 2 protein [Ignavibacteria bacterium]
MKNCSISLVIPVFNEENRIGKTLNIVSDFFRKENFNYEIIIVDDGSTDGTLTELEKFKDEVKILSYKPNKGKGAAVRTGMLYAKGDFRFFSDADLSTPIYEIHKLLDKLLAGADICIGSRAIEPNLIRKHQPFYRELMGKTFNKFVQLLVFKGIEDTQCGFKGFTANASDLIFSRALIDGFSFDVEILHIGRKLGLKIEQVPVEWYNDQRSKVHPIRDSFNMLVELFKIRKLHSNDTLIIRKKEIENNNL